MGKKRITVDGLLVAHAPPWSAKPRYYRKPPPWFGNRANLSGPQAEACIDLAKAATAAYGSRGKLLYKGVSMPIVAVKVADVVRKGPKVHGGLTRAERSSSAHARAGSSIASLETILAQKRAIPA